jgi:hypothetical protein
MKTTVFFSVLFFAFFVLLIPSPASAQMVVTYPIVTGPVDLPVEYQKDGADFYEDVLLELKYQGSVFNAFEVIETKSLSAIPTITNLSAEEQAARPHYAITLHLEKNVEDTNTFSLRLWDLTTTIYPMTEFSMAYEDPEEIRSFLAFAVWQIAAVLPVEYTWGENGGVRGQDEDPAWKTNWLYVGLQAGISFRMYNTKDSQSLGTSFTPGIHLEVQPAVFQWLGNYFTFSLQTAISLSWDKAVFKIDYEVLDGNGKSTWVKQAVEFDDYSLIIPLLFKISVKPNRFLIGPYAGAYYVLHLGEGSSKGLPLGISLGVELGLHAGPGILFLDLGYSADLSESVFAAKPDMPYRRMMVSLSMGYSFGFGSR